MLQDIWNCRGNSVFCCKIVIQISIYRRLFLIDLYETVAFIMINILYFIKMFEKGLDFLYCGIIQIFPCFFIQFFVWGLFKVFGDYVL